MGSLDIDSLFTNTSLGETIDICINQLFENTDTVEGFTKSELKQLLCLAAMESYFIFNGLLYKQTNGIAMGSALGLLSYYEKKLVKQFLDNIHLVKEKVPTVERKHLLLVLLYLSLQTRTKLQQAIKAVLTCCKLEILLNVKPSFLILSDLKTLYPKILYLQLFINFSVASIMTRVSDTWI